MKILWQGFCGRNFSWSVCAQNICRELIKLGHDVHMFSTNGNQYFPEDLKPNLIGFINEDEPNHIFGRMPDQKFDMQLSYTCLKNFSHYFLRGDQNRFGIWNYETTVVPKSFIKHYKSVDKVLPSSNFSKKIFTDNGMPEDHQVVISHGINPEQFLNKDKYPLKTKKKIKFLVNIAQPHLRKNIPNVFKAYGKAFTKADDVCLVIKIAKKSPQPKTDSVPFDDIYRNFCKEFKNHAEVEIISDFIVDIVPLYNVCDVVFSMSYCECFWLPGIEAVAANKIIIHPNYGGALDFLNENNSILIPGKEIRADIRLQYWEPSPYAKMFEPNVEKATQALKDVYNNYEDYLKKFTPGMQEVAAEYTWENATKKIMDLVK